ncbi:tetraspanin-33-like [Haliotis asinina]|uniref:tetraspanin-33-like n=1 Tax=Haliotis asinina TaxID=109174 RepID=UPI0035321DB1
MGCCAQNDTFVSPVVKYILFFANFLFWLIGCLLVAVGTYAFIEKNRFSHVDIQNVYDIIFDLSIIFIVVGIIIFFLGFSGCVGALRENTCLLKFFYIIIIIIFLLEVAGAVLAFVFRDKAKDFVINVLQQNLITRYEDDPDAQNFIDFVQENVRCCGVTSNGYKDWNSNPYYNCTELNKSRLRCFVPHSCCINQNSISDGVPNILCGADALKESATKAGQSVFTMGCVDAMIKLAEDNLPLLGGIIIAVTVPQLIAICLSRMLEGQILDQLARWRQQR